MMKNLYLKNLLSTKKSNIKKIITMIKKILYHSWYYYIPICLMVVLVLLINDFMLDELNKINDNKLNKCEKFKQYQEGCLNLFKNIRYPNKSRIHIPPLRYIPNDLLDEFTQNGKIPIRNWLYINEAYKDSNLDKIYNRKLDIINKDDVKFWQDAVKKRLPLNYGDQFMTQLMFKYENQIKNKLVGVIGTQSVWIEAIALEVGASKVTTLEYTRKEYEDKEKLEWIHVNDYLDKILNSSDVKLEQFDSIASFSSIEHSGLGRYGDPLDGFGDIKTVRQIHCMTKPGGLFFLGLPTTKPLYATSYIEFNLHRVYGFNRLKYLFDGWQILEQTEQANNHQVFVLKKISIC
jgi:hypothetical protein